MVVLQALLFSWQDNFFHYLICIYINFCSIWDIALWWIYNCPLHSRKFIPAFLLHCPKTSVVIYYVYYVDYGQSPNSEIKCCYESTTSCKYMNNYLVLPCLYTNYIPQQVLNRNKVFYWTRSCYNSHKEPPCS